MKIIHTSDWHLGSSLYGRSRQWECAQFFEWLLALIRTEQATILLIAGDIFDTTTPSNQAQKQYYQFLMQAAAAGCRHLVVTAGNHDSPTFLDAPRELLAALNVQVIGSLPEQVSEQVLLLCDQSGAPELIVGAVPYLRDADIRRSSAGESIEEKGRKLVAGVSEHYKKICAAAELVRAKLPFWVPLVVTGHLFTAGGKTVADSGVRELYVGSLAHLHPSLFPEVIDYLALGHLHLPQEVGGSDRICYSGAPLAMSFGEARQEKSVRIIEFVAAQRQVRQVSVPTFQRLESVQGDMETILARLAELAAAPEPIWLEVVYAGAQLVPDLRAQLENATAGTLLELLRITNRRVVDRALQQAKQQESLDDLQVADVFARCLADHKVPHEQQAALVAAFNQVVADLAQVDKNAE